MNDTPGSRGVAKTSVDTASGMVRTEAIGFWSVDQVNSHFDKFSRAIAEIRSRDMAIIVISDLRGFAAQSQEVLAVVSERSKHFYRAADRVAIVVPSSLVKLQMRRTLPANHEMFLSISAAETWACAYQRRPTAAHG